jgi:hypothetical protein
VTLPTENLYYWFAVGEGTLPLHLISYFAPTKSGLLQLLPPPRQKLGNNPTPSSRDCYLVMAPEN